jgi:hypothetical protein
MMTPDKVQGYCQHLFIGAKMNFTSWWNSTDPDLHGKPSDLVAEMPMLVVDRAEQLVEFEAEQAA